MRMNLCYALMALLGLAPFMGVTAQYDLTIEQSTPAGCGGTVYRFYVEANDPSDKISAVFGNDQKCHLVSQHPCWHLQQRFQQPLGMPLASTQHFLPLFPELADDSFATIGLEGPAASFGCLALRTLHWFKMRLSLRL